MFLVIQIAYARSKNLGGIMIWSIDLDDEENTLLKTLATDELCNTQSLSLYEARKPRDFNCDNLVTLSIHMPFSGTNAPGSSPEPDPYHCSPVSDQRWWTMEDSEVRAVFSRLLHLG
jgi:hypothetical protein